MNLCKGCSIACKHRKLELFPVATETKIYEARCCREEAIVFLNVQITGDFVCIAILSLVASVCKRNENHFNSNRKLSSKLYFIAAANKWS